MIKNLPNDLFEISNVLRGDTDSSQIKEYLFTLVTLKFLSENNAHGYRVPSSAAWEDITAIGFEIGERLNQAAKEIEEENLSLHDVLTIIDFSKLYDTTIFKITSILNKYRLSHNDIASQFAETLFYYIVDKEGARGGEFSSPNQIAYLLVRLLNIRTGSVYDGTAGLNKFLIEAFKFADGQVTLFGQEKNITVYALGMMNFILHGLDSEVAHVKKGDTIRNPQFIEDNRLKQFDHIIMNPPFGLQNWGHTEADDDLHGRFRYGIPSKSYGDMAFVLHAVASLKKSGKAAIIVPPGALIRGSAEQKIREGLLNDDLVEAVISLPPNLFVGTGIATSVLILNKNKDANMKGKVMLINAQADYEKGRTQNILRNEDIEKITRAYMNEQEVDQFCRIVSLSELKDNEWNLHPERYFEKNEVDTKFGVVRINRYTSETTIKDVAEVFRGVSLGKEDTAEEGDYTHRIINLSDVQDGEILLNNLTPVILDDPKRVMRYEVYPGDILISSRGSAIKITIVPDTDEPLLLSNNLMRIRVRNNDKYDPHFLKTFLVSPVAQLYLEMNQRGSTVTVLSPKDIESIPIPSLPLEQQRKIAQQMMLADEQYENTLQEARMKQREQYQTSYRQMGIADSIEEVDQ
ncbi:MAG: methyltransferase [Paenibacillus sp.]|jgi:type I restriction enzyme M protein|nr:methyltransferase [Paenibacillus sp.]